MNKILIDELVQLEWTLFQQVENEAGRASCQDNFKTFYVMRSAQFNAWTKDLREQYLGALKEFTNQGRNVITEKYARMMEYTAPLEYKKLQAALPAVSAEAISVVDKIAEQLVMEQAELRELYPNIGGAGRPLRSSQDRAYATSFETYLRSELLTYPLNVLEALLTHIQSFESSGKTYSQLILENTVSAYGFRSLSEAEQAITRSGKG